MKFGRVLDGVVVEIVPAITKPSDDPEKKPVPLYHPDVQKIFIEIPDTVDLNWTVDKDTGELKPPVSPAPPSRDDEDAARRSQIRELYVHALLTKNATMARDLETEYATLLNSATEIMVGK